MNGIYQPVIDALKTLITLLKKEKNNLHIKTATVSIIRSLEVISELDVSEAAQLKANDMGIGDLHQYRWSDQTKQHKMNDKGRKIFHWEHFYPVQQIIDELIDLDTLDDSSIYDIIRKMKICWILKEENVKLDAIAKSKRPDPHLSYTLAGINLLGEKN